MRGLYIHVPFCSVKCFYCDFTAFAGQRSIIDRYLSAVDREAASYRNFAVDSLYIGGGTPSELSASELRSLLSSIERNFRPIRQLFESTFEANPESLTEDKLLVLREFGVNRVSMGLQTTDPVLLKAIGRRHSMPEFHAAFAAARAAGMRISIDLMTGLPEQTLEQSDRAVDEIIALSPEHMSVYGLSVEDRTLFAKRGVEVDEDLDRRMYESALKKLHSAGYQHYEVSNFARPGFQSIHNRIYWENGEYVGLGCGASGFLEGSRYRNNDRLTAYCESIEQGGAARLESESLAGRSALGETLMLRLRLLEGVELWPEAETAFRAELEYLQRQGWLERTGSRARLTGEGVFLANQVFEEFVAPFRSEEAFA